MDGVWVKIEVSPERMRDIMKAEFVDLIVESPNCGETIRLYPKKSIKKYVL